MRRGDPGIYDNKKLQKMLWLIVAVHAAQRPAVPACSLKQGLGLIKIVQQDEHAVWHPAPVDSHIAARQMCTNMGGFLPVITAKNRDCVYSSAHYGAKLRVPVSNVDQNDEGKCNFMYNDRSIYPGPCGQTPHMSGQSDYVVCETSQSHVDDIVESNEAPVLEECTKYYDVCGVCEGSARSCLECKSGCLSGPLPRASTSGSSADPQSWASSAAFLAPILVLICIMIVSAILVSKRRNITVQNRRESNAGNPISFENPQYNEDDNSIDEYDCVPPDLDSNGYLVPNTTSNENYYANSVSSEFPDTNSDTLTEVGSNNSNDEQDVQYDLATECTYERNI